MNTITEEQKAMRRVETMSDDQLAAVWDALSSYNPRESYAPGVSMDDWAQIVYSEKSRRHL